MAKATDRGLWTNSKHDSLSLRSIVHQSSLRFKLLTTIKVMNSPQTPLFHHHDFKRYLLCKSKGLRSATPAHVAWNFPPDSKIFNSLRTRSISTRVLACLTAVPKRRLLSGAEASPWLLKI